MQVKQTVKGGTLVDRRTGLAQFALVTWIVGVAAVGFVATLALGPAQDPTQEQDDPPPRGAVQAEEAPLPQGLGGIGRLRGGPMQMQFNQTFSNGTNGGISLTRSSSNGVTTTILKEADQEIKIEETPDGIFMEVGKSYTRSDVNELTTSHPELAKALAAFPTTADGISVELSVRAVKKYEAINEEGLKDEFPEAYEQYQRVLKMAQGGGRAGMGVGGILDIDQMFRERHERMQREMEEMLDLIR
jgi:hypothetical protein